ncbi:MAG TPA: hypothetical protein PK264_18290, partial [Hyphomicrobiaceae bacterium]|nr:hypothetical protein [Hyphomicrobiaceae bacterium]
MLKVLTKGAVAGAMALAMVAGTAEAQDKKLKIQVAGAFTSSTAILGPAQNRFVDLMKKLSGGSLDAK